jgi:hypothetical protein
LWFALFFSLVAITMTLLSGGEIIERQEVSLPASLVVYAFGGFTGGVILGLLRPVGRRRAGAALLGVVVMIPVGVIAGLIMLGPISHWDGPDWIGLIMTTTLLGGIGGYSYWEPPSSSQ